MSQTTHEIQLPKALSKKDLTSIKALTNDFKKMGISVKTIIQSSGNFLKFTYDPDCHKRNAGRKKKTIPENSSLKEMTEKEQNNWFLNSSIKTITQELNISRATAFRRRAEARGNLTYAIVSLEDE